MTSAPNPYAPPIAEGPPTSGGPSTELEAIRRAHLSSETNIKSIGSLALLGTVLQLIGAVSLMSVSPIGTVIQLMFCFLLGACALGLRSLQPWGRTIYTVLLVLGLGATVFSVFVGRPPETAVVVSVLFAIVAGLFLWVLWNGKAAVVFSEHYREVVVRATPHIKYKTSKIAIGVLVVLLVLFVAAIAAAVTS